MKYPGMAFIVDGGGLKFRDRVQMGSGQADFDPA
jgi:hypothetical protein